MQRERPFAQRHRLHFLNHVFPSSHVDDRFGPLFVVPSSRFTPEPSARRTREFLPPLSWMEFRVTVRVPSWLITLKFGHRIRVHASAPEAKHQHLLQLFLHLVPGTHDDGAFSVLLSWAWLSFVLRSDLWYSLWDLVDSEMDRLCSLSGECSAVWEEWKQNSNYDRKKATLRMCSL